MSPCLLDLNLSVIYNLADSYGVNISCYEETKIKFLNQLNPLNLDNL